MYGNGAKAAVQLLDKALGGSVDEGDVIPFKKSNPANPHLDKDALDTWNKERNQKMAQDMIRLAPEIVEYYKELKDQNKDTETAIDIKGASIRNNRLEGPTFSRHSRRIRVLLIHTPEPA